MALCTIEWRHARLNAVLHAWMAPCMLGERPTCLDATLHTKMPLCTLRSAYPRLESHIYASIRIPIFGCPMSGQIRKHTSKYAKKRNAQQRLDPVIHGFMGGCAIHWTTVTQVTPKEWQSPTFPASLESGHRLFTKKLLTLYIGLNAALHVYMPNCMLECRPLC